jgi:hypothetical protein
VPPDKRQVLFDDGDIYALEVDVRRMRQRVSTVFQHVTLRPSQSLKIPLLHPRPSAKIINQDWRKLSRQGSLHRRFCATQELPITRLPRRWRSSQCDLLVTTDPPPCHCEPKLRAEGVASSEAISGVVVKLIRSRESRIKEGHLFRGTRSDSPMSLLRSLTL